MREHSPQDEEKRLAALHQYHIWDTLPEQAFDDLTLLASHICGTPISMISFIERDWQWVKAKVGVEVEGFSRSDSLCAHAIMEPGELLLVDDALNDDRFVSNPFVVGEPHIRFYAGAPLVTSTGEALGTLCVIDSQPRTLTQDQQHALQALARQAMAQLELRRQSFELAGQIAIKVQNEAVLRESQERFQSFMDNSPLLAFLKDEMSRYVYVNRPLLKRFDLRESDVLGRTDMQLWPQLARQVQRSDLAVLSGVESVSAIDSMEDIDGNMHYWQTYKFPLHQGGGERKLIAGLSLEITENKQYEQQLEAYHQQLEAALQLKDEFISVVSHELRTPLTSIHGALGLVSNGVAGALPERAQGMIEIAHRNSHRLLALINDLLDLQKIESGRLELHRSQFEMEPLVRSALEANAGYAVPLGVSFVMGKIEAGLWVESDVARLNQVLSNLLSNAAKFSPAGATVSIDLKQREDAVRVEVHDQGQGIPLSFQGRIFQKFAQADSSATRTQGGTGLGLSICKAMIEQLGGEIGFTTVPHQGTTFFFEIPLLKLTHGSPAATAAEHNAN